MTVKIKDAKEHIKDLEEDIKEEVIRMRTKLKMEDRTIIKLIRGSGRGQQDAG